MKLHIVVMPQRGLFQGFGTQRPDWKKKKGRDTSTPLPTPGMKTSECRELDHYSTPQDGEDSWHLDHRCRSVLDDQSDAAVSDVLRRQRGEQYQNFSSVTNMNNRYSVLLL